MNLALSSTAKACGCFTPPDPTVPIVQAGERILFAVDANGVVTAHIQIQYSGSAQDFGWLLPLPSVPTLELGTDELFTQLYNQTQPKYHVTRYYDGSCGFGPRAQFKGLVPTNSAASAGGSDTSGDPNPLVIQASIGPYDYAVLHADSKTDMLNWLSTNHYFVPTGTDAVVDAYIHPGAYFLALRLHSGQSTGTLQPVVVHYPSDYPMIPLVLTSVGAQPNMGIQAWLLGQGRAIPRNYFHTVVNDALVDWSNGGQNYNDAIIKAVGEADGKHSFVSEYAGTSSPLQHLLDYDGRFGSLTELQSEPDAVSFVQYLFNHGYTVSGSGAASGPVFQAPAFSSPLKAILLQYIPEPATLVSSGVSDDSWFSDLGYYLNDIQQNPGQYPSWPGVSYQPAQMATQIQQRVIAPTLAAGALLDAYPYLTRLYSTISPEDMNKDPVFSFNPGLSDLSNIHNGTLTYPCSIFGSPNQGTTPVEVVTEQGWKVEYAHGTANGADIPSAVPGSLRIEIVSEEGSPQVVTDNTGLIEKYLGRTGVGCSVSGPAGRGEGLPALLLIGAAAGLAWAGRGRRNRR